ncbi:MAG: hypothetical protein K0S86_2704 [Geminicoccaceae bacterium]|jgi:hypothetical protein|nr:hypothetical protein [Geminicoccaceae bacterium]
MYAMARVTVAMVVTVAAMTAGASLLSAQGIRPSQLPRVGDRVRIIAPSLRDDRFVGRVEGLPRDSILIDTAGVRRRLGFEMGPVLVEEFRQVTIPTSAIQAIDISTGRTHRRSTIKGALIGAVAVGGLFGATNMPEINPTFSDFIDGAAVGVAVGAVAGGIVGYLLGGEKWQSFYRAGVLPP